MRDEIRVPVPCSAHRWFLHASIVPATPEASGLGHNGPMTIAAVILAAGRGRRFGRPKADVRIGARTMVEVVADAAIGAGLRPVIVVAPPTLRLPDSVERVVNDAPEAGLSRSLRLGVEAVPRDAEAVVILLADQPSIDVDHLRALDGWRGGTPIVATRSDGVVGPPVLVEREAFDVVDEVAGDQGLRKLLRERPQLVTPVDHAAIPDIDTPAELDRITQPCPGCGTRYLPHAVDDTHPYVGASPACWATFGELLARDADPAFGSVHRHSADVYAVQHPGSDDRRQRQSVALHLVGMCHWLEHDLPPGRLNEATQGLAAADRDWPWLAPFPAYGVTVVDVLAARTGPEHVALVRRWAEATWEAWSTHHATVRVWARDALGGR